MFVKKVGLNLFLILTFINQKKTNYTKTQMWLKIVIYFFSLILVMSYDIHRDCVKIKNNKFFRDVF